MMVANTTKSIAGAPADDAERLRAAVHGFLRSFGLLSAEGTPCGKPIPLSEAHALLFLLEASRHREQPTHQALAEALKIDKSNVARLCARMETEGRIVQRRSPSDGRARLLSLTARGRRLAEQVDEASRRRFARLLGEMAPELRASVAASLEGLAAAAAKLRSEVSEP